MPKLSITIVHFLADRRPYRGCPSVRLSVCDAVHCIVALRVRVGGWKLYRRVPGTALPIHFFSYFCRMI